MLATVTNRSTAPRGFATLDRGTAVLAPGEAALLDLADHALHGAWVREGVITLVSLSDKDAKAARKRLDQQADADAVARADALAALRGADILRTSA